MSLLLVPFLFAIDQWTKMKAETKSYKIKSFLGGKIKLGLVFNKGAFLGLFKNNKTMLYVFSIVSALIMIGITVPTFMIKGMHLFKLGMSFLIGGGLGNLYDRFKKGQVTDFFSFWIKPKLYFNLADMFIFIGAILMVIGTIFGKEVK